MSNKYLITYRGAIIHCSPTLIAAKLSMASLIRHHKNDESDFWKDREAWNIVAR